MSDNSQNQLITTTETPKGYEFNLLLQEILKVVSLPEELIRCVFAVALSIRLNISPPLWMMLVGVPSSAKTDLVSVLKSLNFVYFLDSMTLNPFASGYKASGKSKTYDLLPELNGKCFICKDYTTIFSLNEETTKKLLGELVSIYDGEFSKFSPTRGYISYVSSFSHIGCITPAALNQHQRYLNIVGPRFIFYRIPALDDKRRINGFNIAWNPKSRKTAIRELSEKVKLFFHDFFTSNTHYFDITDAKTKARLEQMSLLMAKSRGIVILQKSSFTGDNGKEISYYDVIDKQIEEPWRSLGQLKSLAISLALLDNRNFISEADLNILEHIVISSMPAERAEALEYFSDHSDVTAKEMSDIVGKSVRTCQRLLKELESLGIVEAESGWKVSKHYNLHEDFKIIRKSNKSADTPSEFMSPLIPLKPVIKYTDDELFGVPELIKTQFRNNPNMQKQLKDSYLSLTNEIDSEIKRRGIKQNGLPFQDQLWIETDVKEDIL